MNRMIQLKTTPPLLITLALLCIGLLPNAQALSPAPDGGYPGFNTAEGQNALFRRTTGVANTAVGWYSLFSNTDGSYNTGVGAGTLLFNVGDQTTGDGTQNTAIGAAALLFNTTGFSNTATGATALLNNSEGSENTATGAGALLGNTNGESNTADGAFALYSNTLGVGNTANGDRALFNNTTGSGNIALGYVAGSAVTTANSVICISATGANVSNSCFIGNIRGVTTQNANAISVVIDSAGQLGTLSSSRRFKKEIKPMDQTSEAILALKPVTFHYKSDETNTPQFGLIAEEVAEVNSNLVVHDQNGEIYTVRYDAVNAMLLNEFLKEHKAVVEEQHKVEKLEATVANLVATVKEQTAQIQKVSAQLQVSKFATGRIRRGGPARQTVLNNQ